MFCVCLIQETEYQTFSYLWNEPYNKKFQIPRSEIGSCKSSHGSYGGSTPDKVNDSDGNTHWETGKAIPQGGTTTFTLSLKSIQQANGLVLLPRQGSGNKGFPQDLSIEISTDAEEESDTKWTEVYRATFAKTTGANLYLPIAEKGKNIGVRHLRIIYRKAKEGWPAIAELALYKYDLILDKQNSIFSDGTWSKVSTGFDLKDFKTKLNGHPLAANLKRKIEIADWVSNPANADKIHIFTGTNTNGGSGLQYSSSFYNGMPLGRYCLSEEEIEVFADYDTSFGARPSIAFFKIADKNGDHERNFGLNYGYNKVKCTQFYQESIGFAAEMNLRYNQNTMKARLPRIRLQPGFDGHYHPMYDATIKRTTQEYENFLYKELKPYADKVKCPTEFKRSDHFNMFVMKTKQNVILSSATASFQELNYSYVVLKKTGDDIARAWEDIPEFYAKYDGIYENDPQVFNRPHTDQLWSVFIAQAGKPYGWCDGYFTGYNQGAIGANPTTCKTGDWRFLNYNSIHNDGWGFWHEWGHSHDNGKVKVGETTNNMYCLMMQRKNGVPARINPDYRTLANKVVNGKQLSGLFEQLTLLRQVEMHYGEDTFHPQFMRWLRNGSFNGKNVAGTSEMAKWVFAASYFSKKDYTVILDEYKLPYPKEIATENFANYAKVPNELALMDERYAENKKDLVNGEPRYGELQSWEVPTLIQLVVWGKQARLYITMKGSDFRNIEGIIIQIGTESRTFYVNHVITLTQEQTLNGVNIFLTPITLKAKRGRTVEFKFSGTKNMKYADRSNWNATTIPPNSANMKNCLNDDTSSSAWWDFSNDKSKHRSPGFIIDMGKEAPIVGIDSFVESFYLQNYDIQISVSKDNVSWVEFPQTQINATVTPFHYDRRGNHMILIRKDPIIGRYVKVFRPASLKHFQCSVFNVITATKTPDGDYDSPAFSVDFDPIVPDLDKERRLREAALRKTAITVTCLIAVVVVVIGGVTIFNRTKMDEDEVVTITKSTVYQTIL